ncbi:hypothetical protein H6P81_010087 [Aristolochia fimbriata]|uniref:SMP-30/Gluconolactonase/LRE-like region domain-containing protein n=1 Tax=Aristolochia fimbriata TaxID=158543 RepID=A0AAV7ER53_ARIFI|nr:hypothetical protein H6P81_010087 [Aristolochia fimbriata]
MSRLVPISPLSLLIAFSFVLVGPASARDRHVITFRSRNLYPESFKWDPSSQHFVVGSFLLGSLHSVSDAGVVETLIDDPQLPRNVSIRGVAVDSSRGRLLAVVHAADPFPSFDALAAYDLRSRRRLFLARLPDDASDRLVANDVAVDPSGNAFVTNSAGNFVWKVDTDGNPSIFSKSPVFLGHTSREELAPKCGLNGIAYARNGYLLAVQSNTGKVFKVDSGDGTARLVLVPKDLVGADGIVVRRDGAAVIVSRHTAWLLKSENGWAEAVVYDELALDVDKFSMAVAVRGDSVYALYGHIGEVLQGNSNSNSNLGREEFSIEEIEWEKESQGDVVWAFVLLGFGMIYFLYWRFQMGRLVSGMNKKRA